MPDPRRCDRQRPRSRGDREGTYGDPFGLRCTSSRRASGPATTRRSPRTDLMQRRGKADPGVGARGGWPEPEKDNPPRAPSGWLAGGPACSRPIGPLGVISAPRNSRGLPESRSRESRPTTRRPREPHRRNSGWRHPPPSGSPSGPVGPSGRNSNPGFPGPTASAPRGEAESRRPPGARQGDVAAGQTRMPSS